MRKGDEKKQEILTIAERYFCSKGFEATSVQDLIDAAHTSKGGFYHYFPSKDRVLEAICAQRAEKFAEQAEEHLSRLTDPIQRLNVLFYTMMPLRQSEYLFISMLLPTMGRAEGLACRVHYQEALTAAFTPLLTREVALGAEQDVVHPVTRGVVSPVLMLANACWGEACELLLEAAEKKMPVEPTDLLDLLEKYRRSIEVLLDIPYGCLTMISLQEWSSLTEKLIKQFR